jgi:AMMECR1
MRAALEGGASIQLRKFCVFRWPHSPASPADFPNTKLVAYTSPFCSYLPEVAADQGWDQASAIESLIRKAGYHGRITPSLLQQIRCTRYQSSKARVSFDEYLAAKRADEGGVGGDSPTIDGSFAGAGLDLHHGVGRARDSSPTSNCVVS